MVKKLHIKEDVEIEVKNTGVLEVPENKNVDELPIKHFVALANKKGLSTVTRALNNLQVWNKNKDPKLSKWAGDMIDKVTKRVENQKKNESLKYMKENVYDSIVNLPEKEFIDKLAFQVSTCYDPTSERMIVHNLEKSRDAAIDCLEFLLPNYKVSDIMDTIHQRSENISTTNDPYEFENYFYDKVMNKTLDYVIKNEKVSSRYHISYESVNQPTLWKEAVGKSAYNENIHSYDYAERDTIANNIANWVFEGDIDSNLSELEGLIGPLDMEDYEAPETLVDRLMTFDLDTLLYVESELNVQGVDESCTLTEFSSNFDGTEFGEVEFYSTILKDYPESIIKNTIQAKCPFPINIYNVDNEWDGNISVGYEVKEEDYDPDEINIIVVKLLQDLENSLGR